jgi:hypothetical protein
MNRLILLLIPLFFVACSESRMLLESLNKYQSSLEYLHDSKINECDKSAIVSLAVFDNHAFDSLTSVSKINQKVLPLLIYNYEEINFAVNLGQSSLEQNYYEFFKQSFAMESQRTGCYSFTDNPTDSKYTVEIVFDTCKISSKYQRNSTIIFVWVAYSISFQEIGFPAISNLALNVKMKKEDNLIFEKNYSIEKQQPFINAQIRDVNKLRYNFVTNMAESLSLSTKDCIEQIIFDINQVIEKKE